MAESTFRVKKQSNHVWKAVYMLERRKQAEERQAYRSTLNATQQLQALDLRLGQGIGAIKERLRLNALLAA